jgi:phage terminase large subunit-like protein
VTAPFRRELIARLLKLDVEIRWRAIMRMPPPARRALYDDWTGWAHDGQLPPPGDWRVWMIRAGRGFGKTRAGAEWISEVARSNPEGRIALVGATADEVRRVMIEGEAGLLAVARSDEQVEWHRSTGEVRFASGARGFAYAAAAPESLRGPAHHAAWCDELAKWRYADSAWDNLVMGLRVGDQPRVVVTTTPRSIALMRRLITAKDAVETRGRTYDNPHLPKATVAAWEDLYGGSRLGRQELDGELIDDVEGALWTRDLIDACRWPADAEGVPAFVRIVVAVDPPAGTIGGMAGDACGIVCVALGEDARGYVIEDASVAGRSPEGWARAVADCALRNRADRVVAEVNQGGAMVRSVLVAADATLPLRLVHATTGKIARAEPVAALYECGKVSHLGVFGALEDELCGLVAGGAYQGPGRSPDRADALVWALTELMLGKRQVTAVRVL